MAVNRNLIGLAAIVAVVLSIVIPRGQAQAPAAAPAPTSDGKFVFCFVSLHNVYISVHLRIFCF